MKTTVALVALTAVIASTGPRAQADAQPVRREAHIEISRTPSLPPPFPQVPSSFVAANFVLPRATTEELAEYAHAQGGPSAAAWLCDTYAVAPPFDPESASLSGLAAAAAAQGGAQAADALVCPRPRSRLRERTTRITNPGCVFFGDCHVVTYWVMSHDVAYANCPSSGESVRDVDSASCQQALRGRSGGAAALRFFVQRAARRQGCLVLRLSGTGALQLYAQTADCQ